MTPSDANFFVDDEIKTRVFGKTLDEVVYNDWIRALSRPHITKEVATAAVQQMVDKGTPFKISSFLRTAKGIKPAGDADITRPVLLFNIRVQRDQGHEECLHRDLRGRLKSQQWSYAKGFYASSQKTVPMPETVAFQARYWAQRLGGVIEYSEAGSPIKEDDLPF